MNISLPITFPKTLLDAVRAEFSRAFDHPRAATLLNYWDSKRSTGDVPDWNDLDLMDVYKIAPYIFVKEQIPDASDWRNIYFGTRLVRELGFDATNLSIAEYHPQNTASSICKIYEMVALGRKPVRSYGRTVVSGRDYKTYEGIYLPLTKNSSDIRIVLAMANFDE